MKKLLCGLVLVLLGSVAVWAGGVHVVYPNGISPNTHTQISRIATSANGTAMEWVQTFIPDVATDDLRDTAIACIDIRGYDSGVVWIGVKNWGESGDADSCILKVSIGCTEIDSFRFLPLNTNLTSLCDTVIHANNKVMRGYRFTADSLATYWCDEIRLWYIYGDTAVSLTNPVSHSQTATLIGGAYLR